MFSCYSEQLTLDTVSDDRCSLQNRLFMRLLFLLVTVCAVRNGDTEYLEKAQKVTSNIFAINQNGTWRI